MFQARLTLLVVLGCFLATSCSHFSRLTKNTNESGERLGVGEDEDSEDIVSTLSQEDVVDDGFRQERVELQTVLAEGEDDEVSEPQVTEGQPIKEDAVSHYDLPVVVNDSVRKWMKYFDTRGRPHFERYLSRADRYMPMIRKIFKEEGLPEDLSYLALIESGFSVRAYSHAHAVGLWQFIAPTGRHYGLRVNWWIDERRDPELATRAAARYLKDLYQMFDSWYLAAAAYNVGERRIQNAIRRYRTRNFWELTRYRYLPGETKNYIPKLLAAVIMAKQPEKFGFTNIEKSKPDDVDLIEVEGAAPIRSLAEALDLNVETFKDLNPKLRRDYTPPDMSVRLRVPKGSGEIARAAFEEMKNTQEAMSYAQRNRIIAMQYRTLVPGSNGTHVVRRGDTLGQIARRYRVRLRKLMVANGLPRTARIFVGQRLRIPGRAVAQAEGGADGVYVVRRGDTLSQIARRFKVDIDNLMKLNSLSERSRIYVGQRLKVPGTESPG